MKKEIKNKQAIFPMPVLLIATFNEDGSVDVMNAAWGTMFEMDEVLYIKVSIPVHNQQLLVLNVFADSIQLYVFSHLNL